MMLLYIQHFKVETAGLLSIYELSLPSWNLK